MVGFGAPRRTGRLPPFVLVVLLMVIAFLAFNLWSASGRQAGLQEDLAALQEQVQRTEVARSRLEKRHSELMMQADGSRRQLEQRLGEYQSLGERLHARDLEAQRCEAEREKLLANVSLQMADGSRLKEQLHELHQEFVRQEDQLHEYKNNYTLLQKALKEESQQCTKQLADQKYEYTESIKKLQLADKEKVERSSSKAAGGEADPESKMHTIATVAIDDKVENPSSNRLNYDRDAAKVGGDAGMPAIEDNEPAKPNIVPTDGKKDNIDALPHYIVESERQPSLQTDSIANAQAKYLPPGAKKDSVPPLEENVLHFGQLPLKQIPKEPKSMIFPNIKQNDENDGQGDAAEYRKDHFGETL
ncbi:protein GOLM2 isoform X2 [Pseudophryne corroboree]|uniref:protein GOLM2 isoform X2 n=1 Tax=Pseudophryne corroboree TaxID=495146 RepID=UPI0030819A6F